MQFAVSKRILLVCLLFAIIFGTGCAAKNNQTNPQSINMETPIPVKQEPQTPQLSDETQSLDDLLASLEIANMEERFEDSIAIYETVMQVYPTQAATMDLPSQTYDEFLSAANLLYNKKRYTEAFELYTLILDHFEDANPEIKEVLPHTLYAQALNQRQSKQFSEAVETFSKLSTYFPENSFDNFIKLSLQNTYLNWARDCFEKQDYELGLEKLDYIEETWPDTEIATKADALNLTASLAYVEMLHEQEYYEKGLEILKALQQQYPENELLADVQADIFIAHELLADQSFANGYLYLAFDNYQIVLNNSRDNETKVRVQEKIEEVKTLLLPDTGVEGKKIIERFKYDICEGDWKYYEVMRYEIPATATKMILCDNIPATLTEEQLPPSISDLQNTVRGSTETMNIEWCTYEDEHYLVRQQEFMHIRVCGNKIHYCYGKELIAGPEPAPCPEEYTFTSKYEVIPAVPVTEDQILEWLTPWLP